MQALIEESNGQMRRDLIAEIKRLERLKKINPSIRAEEIVQLEQKLIISSEKIKNAQLRLDAVRFVITS